MEVCAGNDCLCFKTLYFSYRLVIILIQNEVNKPTRLLRFVALVTFAVSFLVPRPFCRFTLVYDGHFVLCCKSEKIEPLDRVMANFNR